MSREESADGRCGPMLPQSTGLQRRRVDADPPFLCSRRVAWDHQIPPGPCRTGKHYGKHAAAAITPGRTTTLWRFVEDREPGMPVFGMISILPRYPEIGAHDGPRPWRYFIRSPAFKTQYSTVTPEQAYQLIERYASWRRTGPVLLVDDVLHDVGGEAWEFRIESLSNSHAWLTYGVAVRKLPTIVTVQI